jgi:methyl-accepting chemotaxis protein
VLTLAKAGKREQAVAAMTDNLRTLVGSASQQMASSSEETGKAVGEVARDSAQQAQEAAEVAEGARETAREGVGAAEAATAAMRAVRDSSQSVSEAIRELASKSEAIGGIVETITGIAGQTNLLALALRRRQMRSGAPLSGISPGLIRMRICRRPLGFPLSGGT